MKNRCLQWIRLAGFLGLFYLLVGCGHGGTEIGNPVPPTPADMPSTEGPGVGASGVSPSPIPTPEGNLVIDDPNKELADAEDSLL